MLKLIKNKYIHNIFEDKLNINNDIIDNIMDNIFIYKWNSIKNKIRLRINLLGFNVIMILNKPYFDPKDILNGGEKKDYYIKYGRPFLPRYIIYEKPTSPTNILNVVYKIQLIDYNFNSDKFVSFYPNGAVIWDNEKTRVSIINKNNIGTI